MSDLDIKWHRDLCFLGEGGEKLVDLIERAEDHTLFNRWEWLLVNYERLIFENKKCFILALSSKEGRLVALLPLFLDCEKKLGLNVQVLKIIGSPYTDRYCLLYDRGLASGCSEIISALGSVPVPWDVIRLEELFVSRAQLDLVDTCLKRVVSGVKTETTTLAPVLYFNGKTKEELKAEYGKSLNNRLKRARKKLYQAGDIQVERFWPSRAEVQGLLSTIQEIEASSWKGSESVGIFSSPNSKKMFEQLSELLADEGILDLSFICLDGQPISYRYGFRYQEVFWDYNLAYRPEYHQLSPGRILLDELIISSLENGLKGVDSSRSSMTSPHLLSEWSKQVVEHFDVVCFGRTLKGVLLKILYLTIKPLLKKSKLRIQASA